MNHFRRASRKSLFLSTTILRGRLLKDDNEPGGATGDIEVGPGFAQAADKMSGNDNREPENRGGATQTLPDEDGEANAGEDGDEGNSGEEDGEQNPAPKKRGTAEYIRDLKKTAREEKAARLALEARLENLEKGGLPNNQAPVIQEPTSGKPDPTDTAKYPLGVLDDGYTADLIEWTADQKVSAALAKIDQTKKASDAKQIQLARFAELQEKVETLADKGAEKFDDYDEVVVEAAKQGAYELTETTFNAAAEAEHGADILYALAQDTAEALRVSQLSPYQQLKYVADKDAEISGKKPKARTVPKAGEPAPQVRGGRSSNPIRADTDNLDDFRKIFYR